MKLKVKVIVELNKFLYVEILQNELINAEVNLPKFICNACETTVNYFFEFYNTVKLVQENLRKSVQPSKLLGNELGVSVRLPSI